MQALGRKITISKIIGSFEIHVFTNNFNPILLPAGCKLSPVESATQRKPTFFDEIPEPFIGSVI